MTGRNLRAGCDTRRRLGSDLVAAPVTRWREPAFPFARRPVVYVDQHNEQDKPDDTIFPRPLDADRRHAWRLRPVPERRAYEDDSSRHAGGAGTGIVPGRCRRPGLCRLFHAAGRTTGCCFAVDQSTLSTDAATATLTAQAAWFTRNPQATAVIEGHADERGTREYNIGLSARRANSVVEFLVLNGVAPSRLTTIPYGKDRPLEICSDEACYARNRRAVTVVAGSVDLGS
jgi:peptidoglycan-associated lipoprotein